MTHSSASTHTHIRHLVTDVCSCVYRHIASAEGAFSVVQWLVMEEKVDVNPMDRHHKTPLEVGQWQKLSAPNTVRGVLSTCAPLVVAARVCWGTCIFSTNTANQSV